MVKCCNIVTCRKVRCADFDLTHADPSLFVKSQLPFVWGHWIPIVWNSAWLVYFTIILFLDIFFYTEENRHLWLIHLSNWAILLTACTTLVEVIARMCLVKRLSKPDKAEVLEMAWFQKVQWTVYNINNVISVLTAIIYTSLSEIDMSLSSLTKHVLAIVYVILNTAVISSLPVKLFHFYQPVIYLTFYAIFISMYQNIAPKEELFLVLDWNNPQRSAILLSCVIVIGSPLLHIIFYSVFLLRTYLFKKCSYQDSAVPLPATMQRDITATDVILEDQGSPNFIDVKPEVKDDIVVKSTRCENGDAFNRFNGRLYKSEADLRDYRLKNGLFCDFGRTSLIIHSSSGQKSTRNIFDDHENAHLDNGENRTPEFKGSQIIVVKKYKTCDNENDESDSGSSDCISDVSSDYLSQYITEDILAYL